VTAPEPKVFISYRRRESAGHAGRLYDAMAAQFQDQNVFMDVDIPPGSNFVERITRAVASCHVLLVVMGPRWADIIREEEGEAGIAGGEDFVRLEVASALPRSDVTVIPVLISGAKMPEPHMLPDQLRELTRRNAIELSDTRWRHDVERLQRRLEELLGGGTAVHEAPAPAPAPTEPLEALEAHDAHEDVARTRPWYQVLLEGILVAVAAGLVARAINQAVRTGPGDEDLSKILDYVVWRAETWAFVGAALAVWLTFMRGEPRDVVRRAIVGLLVGALAGALGGATYAVPRFLLDDLTKEQIHLISDTSYAVTGGLLGAMVGSLWLPRRAGVGLAAGVVAGFLQHALWINQEWSGRMASVAFECFTILGVVLGALLAVDALSASRSRPTGPRPTTAGFG
jgi:TIR domain